MKHEFGGRDGSTTGLSRAAFALVKSSGLPMDAKRLTTFA